MSTLNSGGNSGGFRTEPGEHLIANCLQERYGKGLDSDCTTTLVTHSLTAGGHDASEDGTGRGTPLVPISFGWSKSPSMTMQVSENATDPVTASRNGQPAIAYQCHGSNVGPMGTLRKGNGNETGGVPFIGFQSSQSGVREVETHATLDSNNGSRRHNGIIHPSGVRRLTPRECERLMAFPDDWTRWGPDGKEISDSARYRMLGNSIVTTCAEWIGKQIVTSIHG